MGKMTVEFQLPDDDDAARVAMAIEDVASEFGVDEIEWDTE